MTPPSPMPSANAAPESLSIVDKVIQESGYLFRYRGSLILSLSASLISLRAVGYEKGGSSLVFDLQSAFVNPPRMSRHPVSIISSNVFFHPFRMYVMIESRSSRVNC